MSLAEAATIWLDRLRKILELERDKGYCNQVVIGGLDSYLKRAPQELKSRPQKNLTPSLFGDGGFSYVGLSEEERRRWVEEILQRIGSLQKGDLGKPQPIPYTKSPKPPRKTPPPHGQSLDSPITNLKEVTPTLAKKLSRLGLKTVRDLLYFFPRYHLDYSQIKTISQLIPGLEQTVVATVWEAYERNLGGRRCTEAIIGDSTGNMRVVWFNQPYLVKRLPPNTQIVLSGKVNQFLGQKEFESPEWESLGSAELIHTGRLVPVYHLTEGLFPRQMRRLMNEVVSQWAPQVADFLPREISQRLSLLELSQAIQQAHYPDNQRMNAWARRRLAFDELFLIQLGMLSQRHDWQKSQPGPIFRIDQNPLRKFLQSLPFTLTSAQQRALGEILTDLEKPEPMCRLLQGEVGSGKTVVAATALLMAIANGYQGVLMAPTEILAEQHFDSLAYLFSQASRVEPIDKHRLTIEGLIPHPFTLALLTGSLPPSEKRKIQQQIKAGEIDLVIGTHALIQKDVEFENLALVVVDEQHRFGVMQRTALRQKGFNPHMLVMTATPIPRSLALTLYGDLDLSVIDKLPPGRKHILTRWLYPKQREKAYAFLRQKIAEGRQAFVICPLIEESESIQAKAAKVEYQHLSQEVFPDLRLGLVHRRMPALEKEKTMRNFRDRELDILVATSVLEVGIDIPNATVMLVEGAERFGLSQLHQLRGRVGRGEEQSYCLLLSETPSLEGKERLKIIERTQDGFILAEEDLKMRGPGEFFGTRQSGLPDLRMAKISDIDLLELTRKEAKRLCQADPKLENPEHALLSAEVKRLWGRNEIEFH